MRSVFSFVTKNSDHLKLLTKLLENLRLINEITEFIIETTLRLAYLYMLKKGQMNKLKHYGNAYKATVSALHIWLNYFVLN